MRPFISILMMIGVSLGTAITANAEDDQSTIDQYVRAVTEHWRNAGLSLNSVTVQAADRAWCQSGETVVVDPYAITCSSTLVRVNLPAVRDSGVDDRGLLTLVGHEIGHVVTNQLGLQPQALKAGNSDGVQVVELVADCLSGVSAAGRDGTDLNEYLASTRRWLPAAHLDVRSAAFSYGYTGRAFDPKTCLALFIG